MFSRSDVIDQTPWTLERWLGEVRRREHRQSALPGGQPLGDLLAILGLASGKRDQKDNRHQADQKDHHRKNDF
jgi:hypothetical protein